VAAWAARRLQPTAGRHGAGGPSRGPRRRRASTGRGGCAVQPIDQTRDIVGGIVAESELLHTPRRLARKPIVLVEHTGEGDAVAVVEFGDGTEGAIGDVRGECLGDATGGGLNIFEGSDNGLRSSS